MNDGINDRFMEMFRKQAAEHIINTIASVLEKIGDQELTERVNAETRTYAKLDIISEYFKEK